MAYDQQLNELQMGLAGAGFIPGPVGLSADLADAGISLYRGDLLGAGLAGLAAIPGLGMAFAGRHALKAGRPLREAAEGGLDYYSYGRRLDDEFAGLNRYAQIPGVRQAVREQEPLFTRSRAAVADAIGNDPGIASRVGLDVPAPGVSRQDLLPHGPIEPPPPVLPAPFRDSFDDFALPSAEEIARKTGRNVDEVKEYFRRQGISGDITPPSEMALIPPRERPLVNQLADPLNTGRSTSDARPITGRWGGPVARQTEEDSAIEYLAKKAFDAAMNSRYALRVPIVSYTVGKSQFNEFYEWSMSSEPGREGNKKTFTTDSITANIPGSVTPELKAQLIPSDFAYDLVPPDRLSSSFSQSLLVDPAAKEEAFRGMGMTSRGERIPGQLQIPSGHSRRVADARPLAQPDPGASAGDLGLAGRLRGAGAIPPGEDAPLTDIYGPPAPEESTGFEGEAPTHYEKRLEERKSRGEMFAARESITGEQENDDPLRMTMLKPLDDFEQYSQEELSQALNRARKRLNIEAAAPASRTSLVSRNQKKQQIKSENREFYIDPEDEFEKGRRSVTEDEEEGFEEFEIEKTTPGDAIQLYAPGGGRISFEVVDINKAGKKWSLELAPILDDQETIQKMAAKNAEWHYKNGGALKHWGMLQTPGRWASSGDRYPIPVVAKMNRLVEDASTVDSQMNALSQFSTEELQQIVMAIKATKVTQRILNQETLTWDLPEEGFRRKVPADIPRALGALLEKRERVLMDLSVPQYGYLSNDMKDDLAQAIISFSRGVGYMQRRVGAHKIEPGQMLQEQGKRPGEVKYIRETIETRSPDHFGSFSLTEGPKEPRIRDSITGSVVKPREWVQADVQRKILSTIVLPILARHGISPDSIPGDPAEHALEIAPTPPTEALAATLYEALDSADSIDPYDPMFDHMAGSESPYRGSPDVFLPGESPDTASQAPNVSVRQIGSPQREPSPPPGFPLGIGGLGGTALSGPGAGMTTPIPGLSREAEAKDWGTPTGKPSPLSKPFDLLAAASDPSAVPPPLGDVPMPFQSGAMPVPEKAEAAASPPVTLGRRYTPPAPHEQAGILAPPGTIHVDPLGRAVPEPLPESTTVTKGVKKIISGGQYGADRMGLRVAEQLGLQTGGVAPTNYETARGPDLSLEQLGLREVTQEEKDLYVGGKDKKYGPRTAMNIVESDATFLFTVSGRERSPGSRLTRRIARALHKPLLDITSKDSQDDTRRKVERFMEEYPSVQTINIAGNREFHGDGNWGKRREQKMRVAMEAAIRGGPPIMERDKFRESFGLPRRKAPGRKPKPHTESAASKVITMGFTMRPFSNIHAKEFGSRDVKTIELSKRGLRTSTTRSVPLGKVGEKIKFRPEAGASPDPTEYVITGTHKITQKLIDNPDFYKRLSQTEGWTEGWLRKSRMIKVGNWITTYEKVK